MERILNKLNLSYEIVEGVDGFALAKNDRVSLIHKKHNYPRQFNPGELGCLLSHHSVYKRIITENLPYALVLEDDIYFSPRFPALLDKVESHIKQGDLISFYASFPEPCKLYKEGDVDKDYFFIKPIEGELIVGAVAYIITHDAAQKMYQSILPMCNVIDDWRFWMNRDLIKNLKIVFPHPVDLSDGYSDINESSGDFCLKIKKGIVNYNLPVLSQIILYRRKALRWKGRTSNITINGERQKIIFY